MAAHRHFSRASAHGLSRPHYATRCACGASATVNASTFSGTLPSEIVRRKFEQKGWKIGRKDGEDVCPDCLAAREKVRLRVVGSRPTGETALVLLKPEMFETKLKEVELPLHQNVSHENAVAVLPPASKKAEAPRTMSRDDRRLIFVKLEEVYIDERRGYSADWTDAKVAQNMGVPRAWVAEIREQNFGPERNESERSALVEECRSAITACESAVAKMETAREHFAQLIADLKEKLAAFEAA